MTEHQSGLAVGTVIELARKGKPQYATLHRIIPNGEEWRISVDREGSKYVYSEGWRYVSEHRI